MRIRTLPVMLLLILISCICAAQDQPAQPPDTETTEPKVYPPWRLGEMKNPATEKGREFIIPEANIVSDMHGNPTNANFVIYSFGHYYFLLGEFVREFMDLHPETKGRVYYQTMPYGVIQDQLENGGTLTMGNLTITVKPDVFMGGMAALEDMTEEGLLVGPPVPYMTTRLGIMVQKGNPKNIRSWSDLARPGVRLYIPNPETSGTAQRGVEAMTKEGGEELVDKIYEDKVESGENTIIQLHHRQTPIGLMKDEIDAGLTWRTEAVYQEKIGNPITVVDIPDEHNVTGVFGAAMVRNAPHPELARAWLQYLRSPSARRLIESYEFGVYTEEPNGDDDTGEQAPSPDG